MTSSQTGPAQGAASPAFDHMRVDNFDATARPITAGDRPALHELTVSVFWPHRADDLDLFIALGEGYLAIDEIGRPMGSAMSFKLADDFAMLGMMVTAPRLQELGTGRWLLSKIMEDCAGRDLRLSATRVAYRLYESAGFLPVGRIWQHQGIARPIHAPQAVPGLSVRPLAPADHAAIAALDAHAYGAVRARVLEKLLEVSQGVVAEREGAVVGYALCRNFGRGKVVGPVVAEYERMAMHLVAPFVQANAGSFLRLDTPIENEHFAAFLAASGMGLYDTVTEMRIGPQRRAVAGPQSWGLAAQSFG